MESLYTYMAVCSLKEAPAHSLDEAVALKLVHSSVQGCKASSGDWEVTSELQQAPLLPAQPIMPTTVGGPAPTSSRQGRDKQRYTEDGARLVAG